ncbi:MAG TPA: hypothetical protein ENK48_05560 [Gammaproteobacteria bacterium]|nr:hypothetical protein [Gammaproteobacteria bacterium]
MSSDEQEILQALRRIQKTQNTIATTMAIAMGTLMVTYFFTFAMLIDRGRHGMLLVELITTLLFIVAFFFLNRLAFVLTRLRYARRQPHARLMKMLSPSDAAVPPEELLARLQDCLRDDCAVSA